MTPCREPVSPPAIDNPQSELKSAAFSQFSRSGKRGYSIRTKTHRYTEWIDLKSGDVSYRLLFDHRQDPNESNNLASSADPDLIQQMSRQLNQGEGWRTTGAPKLTLAPHFTDTWYCNASGRFACGAPLPLANW